MLWLLSSRNENIQIQLVGDVVNGGDGLTPLEGDECVDRLNRQLAGEDGGNTETVSVRG